MSVREHDETWPFLDNFTSERAMLQQEILAGLPLFRTIGLPLDKLSKDYTKVSTALPPTWPTRAVFCTSVSWLCWSTRQPPNPS